MSMDFSGKAAIVTGGGGGIGRDVGARVIVGSGCAAFGVSVGSDDIGGYECGQRRRFRFDEDTPGQASNIGQRCPCRLRVGAVDPEVSDVVLDNVVDDVLRFDRGVLVRQRARWLVGQWGGAVLLGAGVVGQG